MVVNSCKQIRGRFSWIFKKKGVFLQHKKHDYA